MKYPPWLLCVCLCACGEGNKDCDVVIDNLCVVFNGYPITTRDIEWEIREVENRVDQRFKDNGKVSLINIFASHSFTLTYVAPGDEKLKGNRGLTYFNTSDQDESIYVAYWDYDGASDYAHGVLDRAACVCVTGHELLHVVAKYHLGATQKDNSAHNVPGLFIEDDTTVEWNTFVDTLEYYGVNPFQH